MDAPGATPQSGHHLRERLVGILNGLPVPHCFIKRPEALEYDTQISKELSLLLAPVGFGLVSRRRLRIGFCSHLIQSEANCNLAPSRFGTSICIRLDSLIFVLCFFTMLLLEKPSRTFQSRDS